MNKYLVIAVVIIAAAIALWKLTKKKKNVTYLGTELAEARKKENERIAAGDNGPSPMAGLNYILQPDEGFLINPIQNATDSAITALCQKFTLASEKEKMQVRQALNMDDIYTLLAYIKRSTVFAINKRQPEYIKTAMTSVSMIEAERCDYRDVFEGLFFLNYGIRTLGLDYSELYNNLLNNSTGRTKEIAESCLDSYRKNTDLGKSAGYVAVKTPSGIGFVQTYLEPYDPKKNLTSLAFQIQSILKSENSYTSGELTVGTKISEYWLDGDNNKKIQALVKRSSGCISLTGYLKDSAGNPDITQMLLIYVAEFADINDVALLNKQCEIAPSKFSRLAISDKNIFCLFIARSVMDGKKDHETNASLKRFEEPLKKILINVEALD